MRDSFTFHTGRQPSEEFLKEVRTAYRLMRKKGVDEDKAKEYLGKLVEESKQYEEPEQMVRTFNRIFEFDKVFMKFSEADYQGFIDRFFKEEARETDKTVPGLERRLGLVGGIPSPSDRNPKVIVNYSMRRTSTSQNSTTGTMGKEDRRYHGNYID